MVCLLRFYETEEMMVCFIFKKLIILYMFCADFRFRKWHQTISLRVWTLRIHHKPTWEKHVFLNNLLMGILTTR
jgi:hypothetical protein